MERLPVILLVAVNAGLALLVLLSDWGYYQALMVFWLEIVIVGLLNIPKIYVACMFGDPFGRWAGFENAFSAFLWVSVGVGFFTLKFGGIVLVSGFTFLMMPMWLAQEEAGGAALGDAMEAAGPGIALMAGALLVSHTISFAVNTCWRGEYRHANVLGLLFGPYLRLLYLGLVVGFALALAAVQPVFPATRAFAVALVLVKLGGDLASHLWLHRRARSLSEPIGSLPAASRA